MLLMDIDLLSSKSLRVLLSTAEYYGSSFTPQVKVQGQRAPVSPPLCWTKHQDLLAEKLKQGRSQLAGEVHTNIKVLSKIEPKKKK